MVKTMVLTMLMMSCLNQDTTPADTDAIELEVVKIMLEGI